MMKVRKWILEMFVIHGKDCYYHIMFTEKLKTRVWKNRLVSQFYMWVWNVVPYFGEIM